MSTRNLNTLLAEARATRATIDSVASIANHLGVTKSPSKDSAAIYLTRAIAEVGAAMATNVDDKGRPVVVVETSVDFVPQASPSARLDVFKRLDAAPHGVTSDVMRRDAALFAIGAGSCVQRVFVGHGVDVTVVVAGLSNRSLWTSIVEACCARGHTGSIVEGSTHIPMLPHPHGVYREACAMNDVFIERQVLSALVLAWCDRVAPSTEFADTATPRDLFAISDRLPTLDWSAILGLPSKGAATGN